MHFISSLLIATAVTLAAFVPVAQAAMLVSTLSPKASVRRLPELSQTLWTPPPPIYMPPKPQPTSTNCIVIGRTVSCSSY